MRRWFVVPVVLLAAGCKAPVEAPAELSDLSLFLFSNFHNEDPDFMVQGLTNLDAYLATQDLEAPKGDRATTLPIITGADLGDVVPPEGVDPALQEPIAFYGQSTHPLATLKEAQTDPNQICMGAYANEYSAREFTSDVDCFLEGMCPTLTTTNEIFVNTMIADVWLDIVADFLVVELEDGRQAMISRAYLPEVAPTVGGDKAWEQRFTIDVWLPAADDAAPTKRYYAIWSSTTAISGSIYTTAVKNGLDEYFLVTDDFLSGGDSCPNDRDAEYDRE